MKRRRFLAISAAAGALAASPARAFRLDPVEWRGTALGAAASLVIHHEDRGEALRLLDESRAELERLEKIFSLYRADSALVRLNADGRLDAPPLDLVALLGEVDRLWRLTEGAFDPTVQPVWDACVRHFASPGAKPAGPPIEAVRPLIGWNLVSVSAASIGFSRPGMALTLNGIAQGYITDRIADMLKAQGMRHVLANLGEIRAIGRRGDGIPWRALAAGKALDLEDCALAISSAEAFRFSPACHHLIDPRTARSAAPSTAVSVTAPTATLADGLSTACAVAWAQRESFLAAGNARLL